VIAVRIEEISTAHVQLKPVGRLDPRTFDHYRRLVRAAGGSFDPMRRAQTLPMERLRLALSYFENTYFRPLLSDPLKAHLGNGDTPDPVRDPSLQMRPFQEIGAQWLGQRRGAVLGDEMGVGKTVQAVMAIPPRAPTVVIGPQAAKGVWRSHFRAWRPETLVTVFSGRNSFRWPMRGESVVLNYDILPEFFPTPLPGTIVIADEAHAVKNEDAQRTRKFRTLATAAAQMEGSLWALTGTPLLNRPPELQSILTAVGVFEKAFGSEANFNDGFPDRRVKGRKVVWGDPAPWVPERLKTVMLRRSRRDVWPQIPPKTYQDIVVEDIPAQTRKQCDELVARLAAHGIDLSRATERVDLAQIQQIEFTMISKIRAALATAKIPAMLEQVEMMEAAGEPLVVFSCHREPIDMLGRRTGWAAITGDVRAEQRTEIVDAYQAGKLRGVASTMQSGGTAITLTRGHMVLLVDLFWTPGINLQAVDRVCRMGQNRGVVVLRLVADHALEHFVTDVLTVKERLIDQTIDAATVGPDEGLLDVESEKLQLGLFGAGGRRCQCWCGGAFHGEPGEPARAELRERFGLRTERLHEVDETYLRRQRSLFDSGGR